MDGTVFVCADGDSIGARIGVARLRDDVEGVRKIDAAIRAGNDVLLAWSQQNLGSLVECGGDEIAVEVPIHAIATLEEARRRYGAAVGATLSVGVGGKLSEAASALMVAKLRGKDRIVIWSPEVKKEADAAVQAAINKPESEKIAEEYLGKTVAPAAPVSVQTDSKRDVPIGAPIDPELLKNFHAAARKQKDADGVRSKRASANTDAVRGVVAEALTGLKAQIPVLQQVRATYPAAWAAVQQLVSATIALGRAAGTTDDGLAKAERLPRIYKAGSTRIPSGDHPMRARFDQDYLQKASVDHGNGDPLCLASIDLDSVYSVEPWDPQEVRLYSDLLKAGDPLPPPVVDATAGRILSGVHAIRAAAAAGQSSMPMLVRGAKIEADPSEGVPEDKDLTKEEMMHPASSVLPVGTLHSGKIKVTLPSGRAAWRGVRAGMIQAETPHTALFGAVSHPVSSREPGST